MNSNRNIIRRTGKSHLINYAIILACLMVILAGIHASRVILAPIFMATFFAVLLLPPLRWLRSKGFSKFSSLTVVIVSVLICGMTVTTIIGAQLTQFARNLPLYRDKFNEKLINYNLDVGDFIPFLKSEGNHEEQPAQPGPTEQESGAKHKHGSPSASPSVYQPSVLPETQQSVPSSNPIKQVEYAAETKATSPSSHKVTDKKGLSGSDSNVPGAKEHTKEVTGATSGTKSEELSGTSPGAIAEKPLVSPAKTVDQQSEFPSRFWDYPTDLHGASGAPVLMTELGNSDTDHNGVPDVQEVPQTPITWAKASEDAMKASSQELFKFVAGLTGELSIIASSTFIIMLLVIFMLIEASKLPLKVEAALGKRDFTSQRVQQVTNDIRRYMMIKTFVSILVGLFVTILLLATKVQYPFLWGFVAFMLNFIPNIGSVVAAIPPIILGMTEHGMVIGAILIVFYVAINCGIGYALEPKLLGDGLDLSPLVVLISLLFCGWLLGAIGMFLSPPLAVIIKIILQSFPETKWIAVIMANRVPRDTESSTDSVSV